MLLIRAFPAKEQRRGQPQAIHKKLACLTDHHLTACIIVFFVFVAGLSQKLLLLLPAHFLLVMVAQQGPLSSDAVVLELDMIDPQHSLLSGLQTSS